MGFPITDDDLETGSVGSIRNSFWERRENIKEKFPSATVFFYQAIKNVAFFSHLVNWLIAWTDWRKKKSVRDLLASCSVEKYENPE